MLFRFWNRLLGWASNACSGDSDGNSNISVRSNKQSRRICTAHAFRLHRVLHQSLAFALMSALDGWTDRPADWSFEKKKQMYVYLQTIRINNNHMHCSRAVYISVALFHSCQHLYYIRADYRLCWFFTRLHLATFAFFSPFIFVIFFPVVSCCRFSCVHSAARWQRRKANTTSEDGKNLKVDNILRPYRRHGRTGQGKPLYSACISCRSSTAEAFWSWERSEPELARARAHVPIRIQYTRTRNSPSYF